MKTVKEWEDEQQYYSGDAQEGREDWLVVLGRHRDSDLLENTNFDAAVKSLGGESDTVEILRFGHFLVGWTELLVCSPDHRDAAEDIERALDDYPVLDEDAYSAAELEMQEECWENYGESDFRAELTRRFSEDLDDEEQDKLEDAEITLEQFDPDGRGLYHVEGSGVYFDVRGAAAAWTLADVRDLIDSPYDYDDGTRSPFFGLSCNEAHDLAMAPPRYPSTSPVKGPVCPGDENYEREVLV